MSEHQHDAPDHSQGSPVGETNDPSVISEPRPGAVRGWFSRLGNWRIAVVLVTVAILVVGGWALGGHLLASAQALPDGVVARVSDVDVSEEQFEAQRRLALYQATISLAGAEGLQSAGLELLPLDEGTDTALKWVLSHASKDKLESSSHDQIAATLEQTEAELDANVLIQLLTARINDTVAGELGAEVDGDAFDKQLEKVYASFGGEEHLAEFTAATEITDADLRERLSQVQLSAAIEVKVRERAAHETVTDAELRRYYEENLRRFVTVAETRDAGVIVTDTEADAVEARNRIEAGESFAEVAKQIGAAGTPKGGVYEGAAARELPANLREVVFTAEQGLLSTPVEISAAADAADGENAETAWAVVRVDTVTPEVIADFAEVEDQLEKLAVAQKPDWAWSEFQEQTRAEWLPQIRCAPDYFVEGICAE